MQKETSLQKALSRPKKKELINSATHGLGVLVSIFGLVMLILKSLKLGSVWATVSFSLYGSSLILLFFTSALYHKVSNSRIKSVLNVIDHSSIYILIGGTYTPITLVSLRGGWGWSLFGTVWGLALLGIVFSVFFKEGFPKTTTATYVVMGWLAIIALPMLFSSLSPMGFWLLVSGGLIYTSGIFFYNWDNFSYNHAVWHLFVLGGAACHYFVIYSYVVPS